MDPGKPSASGTVSVQLTVTPIDSLLPEALATLEKHTTLLLQAPPGAGKTTRVPPALLDANWRKGRKILMLEPRRLAARSAARFMAKQLNEPAGQTIGYRTRLDTRVSKATQIEVVTEGILTRLIQSDPSLDDYAAIIFDEFHERSLQADLGLALVREASMALREDLRIIVMSATLDTAPIASALGNVPILTAEGRAFPVEVIYSPKPGQRSLVDHVAAIVGQALADQSGSLLVFLPGAGEIRRVETALNQSLPERFGDAVMVTGLYGNMNAAAQDRAIAPAPAGQRKVVLASAIAESSLTIEGIRVVVDAGLQRRARFDPNSGMDRLITSPVSKASAEQRRGRAGRLEPGVCYRLWDEATHYSLADFTPPEILEADMASVVIELAQWGARCPKDLDWIDTPPSAHWNQATDLLAWLGILDAEGRITDHGRRVRNLGIHPRLAHMVVKSRDLGLGYLAAELAALLSERDLLGQGAGADISRRIDVLRNPASVPGESKARVKAVKQAAERLTQPDDPQKPVTDTDVGRLLALAFPDRVARRRSGSAPRYQLSNGKGASLRDDDPMAREDWLVAAELDGHSREARIYLAAPLVLGDLEHDLAGLIRVEETAKWDDNRGIVVAQRRRCLGRLTLTETALPKPDAALLQQGLLREIKKQGLASLPWSDHALQWRARAALLRELFPGDWPDVSDEALLSALDQWLAPFLAGYERWSDLKKLPLVQALETLVSYQQQQALNALAPTTLTIPTGQKVALDYRADGGPVLAAKLQALFGWTETPTIANGRCPVVIHLLSPAQRPLAVTSDLGSFWRNAYPEVRKDMRGRYPKHPWPEDPLTAEAQQGTKKRPAAKR